MNEITKTDELEEILTQQELEKLSDFQAWLIAKTDAHMRAGKLVGDTTQSNSELDINKEITEYPKVNPEYRKWQIIYQKLDALTREAENKLKGFENYCLTIKNTKPKKEQLLKHIDCFLHTSAIVDKIFSPYFMPLINYIQSEEYAKIRKVDSPFVDSLKSLEFRTKNRECQIKNYGERMTKMRGEVENNNLKTKEIEEFSEIVFGYIGAITSLRNWLNHNTYKKSPYKELLEIIERYNSQRQIKASD